MIDAKWTEYYIQYKINMFDYMDWTTYENHGYVSLSHAKEEMSKIQKADPYHQFRVVKKTVEIEVVE